MTIPHDSLHSSNASNEPGSPASWQAASIASEVLQCLGREGPWGCSFKRPSLHLTGSNKLAIQSLQIYPNLPNTSQSFGCFSCVFFFRGKNYLLRLGVWKPSEIIPSSPTCPVVWWRWWLVGCHPKADWGGNLGIFGLYLGSKLMGVDGMDEGEFWPRYLKGFCPRILVFFP